jgi:hypothetical protein
VFRVVLCCVPCCVVFRVVLCSVLCCVPCCVVLCCVPCCVVLCSLLCCVVLCPCCVLRVRKEIFVSYVSRTYFSSDQGKNEMIVACGTHVGEDKWIRDFVLKSLWTKTAWNT